MDITSLPYFTPLVKDYTARYDSSAIRNFFSISPEAPHESLREIIDARLVRERALPSEHRKTVVRTIRSLHSSLGQLTAAEEKSLECLSKPDILAVVTGQQAGILGGPLYTFYKAITAVEAARSLSEQFPQFSFVPVFWIETEDHDIEEISSVTVLSAEGEPMMVRYLPSALSGNPGEQWHKQAGPLPLEDGPIQQFFSGLQLALPQTEFTAEVLQTFQQLYVPGRSIAHAFAALLIHYFGNDGLLVIDANSHELKSLGKELFRKEIEASPQLSDQIILASEKLESDYHAQVKPRALNLFYITEEGDRLPIVEREQSLHNKNEGTERSFFLQGTRKTFTLSQLLETLETAPERFSPNVVMRPLYQDSLLPTIAYVAGPGEIAYFAQFKPAYEWAGLPMPLIRPRFTATIIEERLERILKKFRITAEDVLSEAHGRNIALFDAMIESDLAPKFASAIEATDGTLESLREIVRHADPTLDGALTSLKGKVLTAMRDFEHKTLSAERKRHASTKAQLDKLLAALLPSGELQERELNLAYFLNKYGPNFYETLKTLIQPLAMDFHEHHLIHLLQQQAVFNDGMESKRTSAAT